MIETLEKTFSFAEFEIDAVKRRLTKNGQAVALNPKAFDLLLALIKNRGQILLKEELLETVWANQFVEENNLTVHVSALRKIFGEKKGEHKFIVTVPGKGYKFVARVRASDDEGRTAKNDEKPLTDFLTEESFSNKIHSSALPNGQHSLLRTATENSHEPKTLIGRETETAQVVELLRRGDGEKLITLTGTGGTGKTRLARAIADELASDFPDGVFFVELAAVSDAERLVPTMAQALGVKESGGVSLADNLKNYLRERRTLLVLDNFEQLISAAALLKELSVSSSHLKILVTSRAALRIENEREFTVSPLALPPQSAVSPEELSSYAAVALFVQRAQAAKPSFVLTNENAPVVAAICQKLDGLPLAIELAAARIKLLAPQQILDRLGNSLKLLTGGAMDSPSRHQTMRGAIEWSYDLLDADQKILFRRLAVFAGGFSVEAAESIAGSELPVLDLLGALVDNNLLAQIEQTDGGTRLRMLEVVREFALERSEASGESEFLKRKHAEFFLAFAEEAEPHLMGEHSVEWLKRLETEIYNIRAALQWSLEADARMVGRLAAAARYFWIFRSNLTEGINWAKLALEKSRDAECGVRFKLLSGQGILARLQGDYETARKLYQQGLDEGEAAGERRQIAQANAGVGTALQLLGDLPSAQKSYTEALSISRELNDEHGIAYALICLGILARTEGNQSAARRLLEESLWILRKFGNKEAISNNLNNLGGVALEAGDFDAAQTYFTEALEMARAVGNKVNITDALSGFAALAANRGEAEKAVQLSGAAENLRQSIGYEREVCERRFCDSYMTKARRALDGKIFAEAFEQGKVLNLGEVVALAHNSTTENGSYGEQMKEAFSEFGEQTEIIIENHSFSRIIIEEEISENEPDYKIIETEISRPRIAVKKSALRLKIIYAGFAAALLAILLTFWFWNSGGTANNNQFELSKLTTSGKVTSATITPDSKYAIFAQSETDGESLWLRHITTGSQKQILPAKPVRFVGLAVAPDGNIIYATIFSSALSDPQVWRVPLLGGSTEEIKNITTGAAITFSPDGKQIAFIESRSPINENHLMISDADGANKRTLLRAKGDSRSLANFNANPVAWSPEGGEIACAVDEKNETGAMKAGIILVNPADGSERFISDKRWDYLENLTWTDAENLAFIAYTSEPWQSQIWTISKRTGETRQITKDLNSYSWLASGGGNLLTVQKNAVSNISIGDFDEKTNRIERREIYNESGLIEHAVWTNDGAVLYTSSASGKREIWRVENDGSKPAQLTVNSNIGFGFAVSPADGSIVFSANEDGRYALKLMNADGKDIRPLTDGAEDVYPNFTADGQTVVFQRGIKNKLFTMWRVSLHDKNPVQITRTHGTQPAVSPDGTQVAHYFMDAETDNLWRIRLVSIVDGTDFGKLSLPKSVTERRMRWHPSGQFVSQIFYEGDNIKLLNLPVGGGNSQIVSGLGKGNVNWFDWSGDGRQIVVSHTTATQDVVLLSK